jgi:hypothetical protein
MTGTKFGRLTHPASPKSDNGYFESAFRLYLVVFGGRVPFRVGARRAEGVALKFFFCDFLPCINILERLELSSAIN